MIELGKLYTPKDREKCSAFRTAKGSLYIRYYADNSYHVLDKDLNYIDGCSSCFKEDELIPARLEGQYLQGDILVNEAGAKRKILGVCGEVYFVSATDDFSVTGGYSTKAELDTYGFKLSPPEVAKKMTVEEISKELGYKVEIIE